MIMKFSKLILLPIVLISFVLVNCSKSSDPAPSIVGTWLQTSMSTSGCTNTSLNIAEMPCTPACSTLVFTSTQFTNSLAGNNSSGTYTLSGNTIVFSNGLPTTYTITATTLTLVTDISSISAGCKRTEKYTRQ